MFLNTYFPLKQSHTSHRFFSEKGPILGVRHEAHRRSLQDLTLVSKLSETTGTCQQDAGANGNRLTWQKMGNSDHHLDAKCSSKTSMSPLICGDTGHPGR